MTMRDMGDGFSAELERDEHPLWALHRIAERQLAPLGPIFTAMRQGWTATIGPDRALKSLILMAFFDVGARRDLCTAVAEIPAFRQFLDVSAPIHADDLSLALDRLQPNAHARAYVRNVVGLASAAGLDADERFSMNEGLVGEWTSTMPM